MLVTLLRRIFGYVEFYASGGFAERFINLCTLNGINLWDVKNDGVKVYACTDFDGYKRIKKCARGSGMRVKIVKKHGAFLLIKRRKSRLGLGLGAAVAVLLLIMATGRIWSVEVEGVSAVKAKALTEILEEYGVKTGVGKSKIDSEEIEKLLQENDPELLWASINIYGTRLVLEVRETEKSPETKDTTEPVNIVASKRGKVVLVKGYRGTNKVKEGDFVKKGDILISGVVTNRDLSEVVVRASGSVICETEALYEAECPFYKECVVTENTRVLYRLSFFGISVPLYFKKSDGKFTGAGEAFLKSRDTRLPLGILRECYCEEKEKGVTLDSEKALLYSFLLSVENKRVALSNAEIKSLKYDAQNTESGVSVRYEAVCREDVATEQPFYLEGITDE